MPPIILVIRDAIDDGVANPRGQGLATLAIVFACLSLISVAGRFATRYYMQQLGSDDYMILPALILALTMAVTYNMEAKNGFGLHTSQVDLEHKTEALKWFFVAQLLYKMATCFTKISILLFFLRIFPSKNFHIASYTIGAVCIAYAFAAVCETIWSCNPIEKSWNKTLDGKCLNIGKVWYSTSVLSIVTDLSIIILPIYQIRRLQLPLSQKIGLCLLFSLGFFVVVCTIVRMATVGPAVSAVDIMYYQATSNSWTFLEVNVGIICASLPIFKAPLIKFFPWVMRNKTTHQPYGQFSNDHYSKRSVIPSHNGNVARDLHIPFSRTTHSAMANSNSSEEFILHDVNDMTVKKTTEFNVSYETSSVKMGKKLESMGVAM